MSTIVTIQILGGDYSDTPVWTGPLSDAPVTLLIPEGIVSARTMNEANWLLAGIRSLLETYDRVEVGAVRWAIRVTKQAPSAPESEPL